jgi:hypothetical protein
MKIFRNELYKLFHSGIFLFILIGAVALNVYIVISSDNDDFTVSDGFYREFFDDISAMNFDEIESYIAELNDEYAIDWENYDWENFSFDTFAILNFLYEQGERFSEVRNYDEYLQGIKDDAERMTTVSIFAKKDSFAYRNISLTPSAYEAVSDVVPVFAQSKGILLAVDNIFADLTVLFIVMTAVIVLFQKEKESGIIALLKPLRKGRKNLALAKSGAVFFVTAGIAILFYGMNLGLGALRYGLGDLSRPLQSLEGFIGSNLPISVGVFIALLCILKIFALFFIALFFSALCVRFSSMTAYTTLIITGAVQGILYFTISPHADVSIFKHINIVSFFDSTRLFRIYDNMNLFGQPVNLFTVIIGGVLIGGILCTILLAFFFADINISAVKSGKSIIKIKPAVFKKPFTYTLYKAFITHKGIAVILVVLLAQTYTAVNFNRPYDINDNVYRMYCEHISEMSDEEINTFIAEENERFEKLLEQMSDPEIPDQMRNAISGQLNQRLGFELMREQYEYIMELKSNGNENAGMFYHTGFKRLFGTSGHTGFSGDMYLALLACAALAFCISPLISYDNRCKITSVLFTTKSGKQKYISRNMKASALIAALIILAVNIPYLIQILRAYGTAGMGFSVRCIEEFGGFPLNISVVGYMILMLVCRVIIAALLALIMLFISSRCKSPASALLICLMLFTFPVFLYLAGLELIIALCVPLGVNREVMGGVGALGSAAVFTAISAAGVVGLLKGKSQN